MARKSVAYKRGRLFAAAGWGKYGPYAVGTYRRGRAVAKATVGTRGGTVGARYRVYRQVKVGGEYNITRRRKAFEIRAKKKTFRIA